MSDFDFTTLITDRTQSDVANLRFLLASGIDNWTEAELAEFNLARSKGAYNYTDLNRVTACMDHLNERLTALGYVTGYVPVVVHPPGPPAPTPVLPDEYTELEYIESTGAQWIDTGFSPNQDTRTVVDFELTTAYSSIRAIFGVRDTSSSTAANQFAFWNTSNRSFRSDYFRTSQPISGLNAQNRYVVDKNKNITSIDGLTVTNAEATGQCSHNMVLFAISNVGTPRYFSNLKFYSGQIYDNGTIIRDFIPAKNSNGQIGLYDLINALFYVNAGEGSFLPGPEVIYPEPEPTLDPYIWYEADIPRAFQMARYLQGVAALRSALTLPENTASVPADMAGLTLAEANAIEEILLVIEDYLTALASVFRRCGAAICGGPGFYFKN